MTEFSLRIALGLLFAFRIWGRADVSRRDSVSAEAFVARAERELAELSVQVNRAEWINESYLTEDTDALAAEFKFPLTELSVRLAKGAAQFDAVLGLSVDVRRNLDFLKQGIVLPAPEQPGAASELSTSATRLQSPYGKGKGLLRGQPINGSDIEERVQRRDRSGPISTPLDGTALALSRHHATCGTSGRGLRSWCQVSHSGMRKVNLLAAQRNHPEQ